MAKQVDQRESRRSEIAARLGLERVWFHDDPGVRDVLLDIDHLRVLDFVRRSAGPVQPHDLDALDASLAPRASSILRLLEQACFVRYEPGRRGRTSGYFSTGATFTLAHAESEEALRLVGDYRETIARHNIRRLQGKSHQPFRDHAREPFIDRVFLMSSEEEDSLRDAIFRLFQTTAAIETANFGKGNLPGGRQRMRLTVSLEPIPDFDSYVAPVLVVNLAKSGLSRSWVRSLAAALTARQRQIAKLLVEGRSRREIGDRLGISENTVKSAITEMYRKFEVTTRAQFVARLQG